MSDDAEAASEVPDGADEWLGEECPECGVEIEPGDLRFNGWAWEHKNPLAHAQAGHHVIRDSAGTDADLDGGPL